MKGQIDGRPRRQVGQRFRLGRHDLHPDGAIFPIVSVEQIISYTATTTFVCFRHGFFSCFLLFSCESEFLYNCAFDFFNSFSNTDPSVTYGYT